MHGCTDRRGKILESGNHSPAEEAYHVEGNRRQRKNHDAGLRTPVVGYILLAAAVKADTGQEHRNYMLSILSAEVLDSSGLSGDRRHNENHDKPDCQSQRTGGRRNYCVYLYRFLSGTGSGH